MSLVLTVMEKQNKYILNLSMKSLLKMGKNWYSDFWTNDNHAIKSHVTKHKLPHPKNTNRAKWGGGGRGRNENEEF